MPTDIRKYVDVVVSRQTRPIDTSNFSNPLFITQTNLFDADERIRTYRSIEAMTGDGFSPTSAAVRWATNVFAGTAPPQTVMIGKQNFDRYDISVVPGTTSYSMTIIVTGTAPQEITFTGTRLSTAADIANGLSTAINGNAAINSDVVASVSGDILQVTPQGNAQVIISGLSNGLQSSINQWVVEATTAAGNSDYTVTIEGVDATFTSDADPTENEVITGLTTALNGVAAGNTPVLNTTDSSQWINAGAFSSGTYSVVITPDEQIGSTVSVSAADFSASNNLDGTFINAALVVLPNNLPQYSLTVDVAGTSTTFTVPASTSLSDTESLVDSINTDPTIGSLATAVFTNGSATISIRSTDNANTLSVTATESLSIRQGAFGVNIADVSQDYSFSLTSGTTTETVSYTNTNPFATATEILTGLESAADALSFSSTYTTTVASNQLQISPVANVNVAVTNPSTGISVDFDRYNIDIAAAAAQAYSFNLSATGLEGSQTISYTSDATPTISEILNGLATQINQSGMFGSILVAGVVGQTLQITPNTNEDVAFSSITPNLSMTVVNPESAIDAVNAAAGEDDSWFFLCAEDRDITTQLALGAYCQAEDKMYISTVPASTVASTATDDPASRLRNANLDNTHVLCLPDERHLTEYAEGGIVGAIANFNPGETILAYKTLTGITNTQFSTTEQGRIQGKNANIYPRVSGVSVYDSGVNVSGLFFDDVRFGLWMKARIAEAVFGLLKRESDLGRKVVFGAAGFDQIRQVIYDQVINVAIRRNAILTPRSGGAGVEAPVVRIPPRDQIPDNDIANRFLDDVVVEFTYSGAIQTVRARVFILL